MQILGFCCCWFLNVFFSPHHKGTVSQVFLSVKRSRGFNNTAESASVVSVRLWNLLQKCSCRILRSHWDLGKRLSWISRRILSHMRNSFSPWIRALGKIVWWKKNRGSKISWHCPFKKHSSIHTRNFFSLSSTSGTICHKINQVLAALRQIKVRLGAFCTSNIWFLSYNLYCRFFWFCIFCTSHS
jgi:hypothetical protein